MLKRELVAYLDTFLRINEVQDYGLQGLQVDAGGEEVTTVCLLYTSDAADERSSVDLGGRRIIKKKKRHKQTHDSIHVMIHSTR